MSVINEIEKQRASDTNPGLNQKAFEAAWHAFQNTPIDLLADSDDEQCRCVGNAIIAYIQAIYADGSRIVSGAYIDRLYEAAKRLP